MSATFCSMVTRGKQAEVAREFADVQARSRYERGHHSGGFSTAKGIIFKDLCFTSLLDARRWLELHCCQWGPALAVEFVPMDGGRAWIIGACSSS